MFKRKTTIRKFVKLRYSLMQKKKKSEYIINSLIWKTKLRMNYLKKN